MFRPMSKYIYEARDNSGRIVKGMVEADSSEAAEDLLKYNQLYVLSIKASLTFEEKVFSTFRSFFGGIRLKDKAVFARQLSTMINAGLPLMDSLKYILDQSKKKDMVATIKKIMNLIERGKSFSFALEQFPSVFPPVFVSMVRSGEASGKLDQVLADLAEQMESEYSMKSKIKGALIYPAVILVAVVIVGVFALLYIIPNLEDVFVSSGVDLPILTRILVSMSNILINYWYIVVIIIFGLTVFLRYYLLTDGGRRVISRINLRMPVFGEINRGIYTVTFARTLGLLMGGGVPIIKAISIVSESIGNTVVEAELKNAIISVEKGIPLSVPISQMNRFPPLVPSMIAVGEKTGQLDKVLLNIAKTYDDETQTKLKSLSSLIEPIIMLIVGIAVALLVVAIILPVYQLTNIF
uniref:Type II secretion system F family protein n=1 Tax=candidate division CPR3 bacterium TaxID=2268181 RepID=A0A7C4R4K9_UNCC3